MKNTLKKRVMAQIYIEYIKTKTYNIISSPYFISAFFITLMFFAVSIPNIISNTPKDSLLNSFVYLTKATIATTVLVKIILSGLIVSLSAVVYKLSKFVTFKTLGRVGLQR